MLLAIGVKYSEVSTGFYSQPQHRQSIHVDTNRDNLGRIMRTSCASTPTPASSCNHAARPGRLPAPAARSTACTTRSASCRAEECRANADDPSTAAASTRWPFFRDLRRLTAHDALAFVDVTVSQYWATEAFTDASAAHLLQPDQQPGMGWSIPAALGARRRIPAGRSSRSPATAAS